MTVHNAVSQSVTNRDASPAVANTAGVGGQAHSTKVADYVTVPAAAAATSLFRVVRVPSDCYVTNVVIESEAQGAGKVNVGAYYADSTNDLAPGNVPNSGLVIDEDFFATDVDLASAVQRTSVINESGTNTLAKRQQPLWQALGLSTDPGGKIDICMTVHTTDVTTGTGKAGLEVEYVAV